MKQVRTLFALMTALSLYACGGGGSDSQVSPPPPPSPPPSGGIGRTGLAFGPVTTFGSVVVNGVRYDTASATFTINDEPGSESDLSVGDVVTVQGTLNDDGFTGTADSVTFDDAVTGPVDTIDAAGNSLSVLGQTVFVTPDTTFDDGFSPASLAGVSVGQIVEVSGQFDANGDIAATRIEPKPAGTQFEVHGSVASLNTGTMQFTLGSLIVDYSAAALDNFPGGQISAGNPVEAKGTSLGGSGELLATNVEFEALFPATNADDAAEIEGFITRFVDATDFDVAGFPVTTNGQTVYQGGDANDLGLNVKVEVEGTIDGSGVLVAEDVDIRRAKAVRTTATVDSVNAGAGSIVVLGITVTTDALTRFEDKSAAEVEPLTIADINAGDYVEVRGDEFPAGSGQILATIFEREDPDPDTELQGFVESISNPSFTILGVTIETNGGTVFRDENDAVLSAGAFFARLAGNDLVKASGTETSDTTIVADEVEFEVEF